MDTILIGNDILEQGVYEAHNILKSNRVAIITDQTVEKYHLTRVVLAFQNAGFNIVSLAIPSGEKSKTIASVEYIWNFLIDNNIQRTDAIIALGGGVIGDTAGFAAATYMRGIDYIQIPTTLLSAIDSSIGGKSAINITSHKNMAGAFHWPKLVIADTTFLQTLSNHQWQEGLGEALKTSILCGGDCLDAYKNFRTENKETYLPLIFNCIKYKEQIVKQDPCEKGLRKILNLGHTFGHAIESMLISDKSMHGHCVVWGIMESAKISLKKGILNPNIYREIKELIELQHLNLNSFSVPADRVSIVNNIRSDKKCVTDSVDFVTIEDFGKCHIERISLNELRDFFLGFTLKPNDLCGDIEVPTSKSLLHRVFIGELLSGTNNNSTAAYCDDLRITERALEKIREWRELISTIDDENKGALNTPLTIDCSQSGTTLRLLTPIVAALGCNATFTGSGNLPNRPIQQVLNLLKEHSVTIVPADIENSNGEKVFDLFTINGQLTGGTFNITSTESSQFVSGFLMAAPLLKEDSTITIPHNMPSKGYIDLTIKVLKMYGIKVIVSNNSYFVMGGQKYLELSSSAFSRGINAEGDWSHAANFLAAGVLSSLKGINVSCLDLESTQPDKAIVQIIEQMGGSIKRVGEGSFTATRSKLTAIERDMNETPDIVPIVAVLCAFAHGTSLLKGLERLRLKESDRLEEICLLLKDIGANYKFNQTENSLTIMGMGETDNIVGNLSAKEKEFHKTQDHRILMAQVVAANALNCTSVIVGGAETKSNPNFLKDMEHIGLDLKYF